MPDKKTNSSQDTMEKNTPKCRKRKRSSSTEDNSDTESESLFAIEKKLRSVAKMNNLSAGEMKKLIRKLVVNDHVLAFITLKAEDELAREKDESEKIQTAAVIINEVDPSIPKLTRAKARELNKAPIIALPSLIEPKTSEIATLIQEELHSDEEDEEYTFKDDDFVSDEDPNLTASDIDSQPRTPQTPFTSQGTESSQKFSADGVFKIPREVEPGAAENEIIATRTRSKFCLEQTTIEDIQSEFVPPDDNLDVADSELCGNDQDWMEFLNTFSKPLNNNLVNDDDDPVNDPEYVAAEKVPFDAEELRDVNISKKELTELVAELFEGLLNEGVCMESIELETPKKISESPKSDSKKNEAQNIFISDSAESQDQHNRGKENFDNTFNSTHFQNDFFQPDVMSTPQVHPRQQSQIEQLFVNTESTFSFPNSEAKETIPYVKVYNESLKLKEIYLDQNPATSKIPNISNSHWGVERYIPARKLLNYEYANKFEKLKNSTIQEEKFSEEPTGYTLNQYQILQQQLRIHVQLLTQNFFQTYSHPDLWKIAPQQKQMLLELESLSKDNATFDVCNLKSALNLVCSWERELELDTEENSKLMQFMHKEMRRVSKTHNQVSRFAPRIMKKILNSSVFIYPELLPRIPFSGNQISFHMFAPSESFLIAMGLERHLNEILAKEKNFSYMKRRTPLSVACERITNTIIHGKTPRRLRDHINELRKSSTYNPVKFYYEHKRAPPVEHKIILIDNTNLLEPRHRILELPSVWKEFLQVLNAGGIIDDSYPDNYTRYVKDITGDLIGFPNAQSLHLRNKSFNWKSKTVSNDIEKPSVVININYLFGQPTENPLPEIENSFQNLVEIENQCTKPVESSVLSNTTFEPLKELSLSNKATETSPNKTEKQKKLTEYFEVVKDKSNDNKSTNSTSHKRVKRSHPRSSLRLNKYSDRYLSKKLQSAAKRFRHTKNLQKTYENLLSAYRLNLEKQFAKYRHRGLRFIFRHCKALELYTNLLKDLKMNCKRNKQNEEVNCKRRSNDEQEAPKSRKANRQEENLRHMLLPDSAEDSNRKDAIYAFNFYEKVEEVLKQSKRPEDCRKFNHILRAFDPKRDKVADLYYKLEQLFLPDHPELAHVFLTFLLPPEAAEIGKFFEHFMYTNAGTFFSKLNVYFNKQPAQIRKIYNCIGELSEEPNVSVEKIKSKIFPLLKGNTFLIEWFSQLFLSETPSERLFGSVENANMKEVLNNQTGEYIETLHPNDLLDSPTESQTCQLKFINGRIFYGTKIPLPAKLSFMASSFKADELNEVVEEDSYASNSGCVHGIREYGEKRLASNNDCSSDDNEKSEEEESKDPIVHTALDEDHFETCDESTLRAHAIRLNPSYYSTSCYSNSLVNISTNCHRPLKLPLPATEENKGSPRKGHTSFKERRKSPKKNLVKSPPLTCKRFSIDNHTKSNAIAAANKLKNLIDDEPNCESEQYKKKISRKRKDGETKLSEESEGSDSESVFSPGKEIKQEPLSPWTREEDKIILEEIKSGYKDKNLYERISSKMFNRSFQEIEARHKFLIDFLFKLQSSK